MGADPAVLVRLGGALSGDLIEACATHNPQRVTQSLPYINLREATLGSLNGMHIPESPHFTLSEVAPGVWAALAGDTGASICNTAIVDLGDRTLIFDAFQTIRAAEDLRAAAEALTGRSAAF
jgi:hypothetical protein